MGAVLPPVSADAGPVGQTCCKGYAERVTEVTGTEVAIVFWAAGVGGAGAYVCGYWSGRQVERRTQGMRTLAAIEATQRAIAASLRRVAVRPLSPPRIESWRDGH